jgi:ankyrin repeat protein
MGATRVKWRPKFISDEDIRNTPLSLDDARLVVARYYDFPEWASLVTHVEAISKDGPFFEFEAAVEAVINGDRTALEAALRRDSNLVRAVAFGMIDAANALVRRGAHVDVVSAGGLGLVNEFTRLLPAAAAEARHRALSVAAQGGHVEIVRILLDSGEDPNRFNLEGNHAHSTPLDEAVIGGHEAVVRLLIERGARLDTRDTIWHGTPLECAIYGGGKAHTEVAACLRSLGAAE